MTGGVFFLLAPLFVLALLLLLSFLLYREYQNLPPGAVSPWPWVLAGFFWSVFHSPIPYSWQSPHGNTVFNGCFVNVTSQGPKNFSGIFLADFPDGKRSKILLSLPVSRVLGSLRAGECFSGDVFLSDYPDRRSSRHRFLGFLDNGILQGQIRPWNVFVRDRQSGHPKDWRTFFNGVPARVASLEALLESHFPDDVSSLIEAMVLSDTSHVPSRMNDVFLGSGVYHLLSVSGEHMGLLAAFLSGGVLVCIRFLPLGILRQILARIFIPRLLAVLVIPVLIVYTILIGIPLPAGRALLAASFLLVARGWGASVHREDLFGISVIVMMIFVPDLPRSISMDLSIMAVLGVMAALRMNEGKTRHDVSGMIPLESMKTGLWVTFFTTPLLWEVFDVGDLVGIFSNPVIVPLAGEILLPAGFACLGLAFFFGGAPSILMSFLDVCSRAVIGLATFFSGIRLGQISLPPLPPIFLLAFNGWMLGIFLRKKHSRGPGYDVLPLLVVISPILFLSVSEHLLDKQSPKMAYVEAGEVLPALVRQPDSDGAVRGNGGLAFSGWLWNPQVEVRNLSRLVQLPSLDAGGK